MVYPAAFTLTLEVTMKRGGGRQNGRRPAQVDRARPGVDIEELRRRASALMVSLRDGASALSRSAAAYQVLESLIASIEIPPGSVLSGEQIEQVLGLGRTPVREALKLLQADGLVLLRQKTGVTIAAIEPLHQLSILQVRRPLELLASSLAVKHGDERRRSGLAVLADELLAVGTRHDARSMMRLGTACYHQLLAMTDNKYLHRPLLSSYSLSRRYYYTRLTGGDMMLETTRLHYRRFRAVIDADASLAKSTTDSLMDYFEKIAAEDVKTC